MITSVNNSKIKELSKLKQSKYRKQSGLFIIEGEHLIIEAKKQDLVIEILYLDNYNIEIFNNIKHECVSYEVMKKLSSLTTPPPVIGICKIDTTEYKQSDKIIMLDNIRDPGNLGTIIRSADAFNFKTVVLSPNCVDLYNEKVIRSTQGSLFHLNIIKKDLSKYIDYLKADDYIIYGTALQNSEPLNLIDKPKKVALILGNEGSGVSTDLLAKTDKNIKIEMTGLSESLNVGVAASIVMYEFQGGQNGIY